jgi:hypothetical protein
MNRYLPSTLYFGFIVSLFGCSLLKPPVEYPGPSKDPFNCNRPAQIAVLNKQELELAGTGVGEFVLGQIDYKSQPELKEVMTRASSDLLVVDYLVCVAKARGDVTSAEQVAYVRLFFSFLQSKPTADQIIKWREQNPFPKDVIEIKDMEVGAEARGRLREKYGLKLFIDMDSLGARHPAALSEVPNGVYTFASLIPDSSQKMYFSDEDDGINPRYGFQQNFELHRHSDGSLYVVGFVSAETADQINKRDRAKNLWVKLYSDQWEKALVMVAIPLAEIGTQKLPRGFDLEGTYLLVLDMLLR